LKAFESEFSQFFQLAEAEEQVAHPCPNIGLPAGADLQPAEIGVFQWKIGAQITRAAAVRAVWIA
jgi:hypothetical protein